MTNKTAELSIPPPLRAACSVYAVAMGDRLGLDLEALRSLKLCVDGSVLSGAPELDSILRFIASVAHAGELGAYPVSEAVASASESDPVSRAYRYVARLVQPLSLEG